MDMMEFNPAALSSIVRDKKIMEWENGAKLPETLEGFTLFSLSRNAERVLPVLREGRIAKEALD